MSVSRLTRRGQGAERLFTFYTCLISVCRATLCQHDAVRVIRRDVLHLHPDVSRCVFQLMGGKRDTWESIGFMVQLCHRINGPKQKFKSIYLCATVNEPLLTRVSHFSYRRASLCRSHRNRSRVDIDLSPSVGSSGHWCVFCAVQYNDHLLSDLWFCLSPILFYHDHLNQNKRETFHCLVRVSTLMSSSKPLCWCYSVKCGWVTPCFSSDTSSALGEDLQDVGSKGRQCDLGQRLKGFFSYYLFAAIHHRSLCQTFEDWRLWWKWNLIFSGVFCSASQTRHMGPERVWADNRAGEESRGQNEPSESDDWQLIDRVLHSFQPNTDDNVKSIGSISKGLVWLPVVYTVSLIDSLNTNMCKTDQTWSAWGFKGSFSSWSQ